MKVIKLSLESNDGKYKMFITDKQLLSILENEIFISTTVDAKTGTIHTPDRDIIAALKIEPPKE